jgi:quinol monooxygenase YgiN
MARKSRRRYSITTGERQMTKPELHQSFMGSLIVVARWKTAAGQANKVAEILSRFLPQAQAEPGVKLFLIGRDKADADQFLFYEVFAAEGAFQAHQASDHFKTLIVGQALPLLADRQRNQYTLI